MASPFKTRLEGALSNLLTTIVVEMGLSIPPDYWSEIIEFEYIEVDTFVKKVLEASNFGGSGYEYRLEQKFIKKFGSKVSVESYENSRK